jgi:hypothetical protein
MRDFSSRDICFMPKASTRNRVFDTTGGDGRDASTTHA